MTWDAPETEPTKAEFVPVSRVVTDGAGHFLGVVHCDCDDGSPDWVPSPDCPVHKNPVPDRLEGSSWKH